MHKLEISFYDVFCKWDYNNLCAFNMKKSNKLSISKYVLKNKTQFGEIVNNHYNILLRSHNEKIVEIIYDNLEMDMNMLNIDNIDMIK